MRRALLLASLLLVIAGGCTGPTRGQADQAYAAGDVDRAAWLYRQLAADESAAPDLRARAQTVSHEAAQQHADRIPELREAGDLVSAERAAEWAIYHRADHAPYQRTLAELRRSQRGLERRIRAVEASMAKADWLRARERIEPLMVYAATFPELDSLWRTVARENHRIAMGEGERFLTLHDYGRAESYFADAADLLPESDTARTRLQVARDRLRARDLAQQAATAIDAGHHVQALAAAREAVALHQDSRHAQAVLADVLRRSAHHHLERAAAAEAKGDWRSALRAAEAGRALEVPQQGLRRRVEITALRARKHLAAAYLARAITAEERGLYAAAWLWAETASRIHAELHGLAAVHARNATRLAHHKRYHLVVMRFAGAGPRLAPGAAGLAAEELRKALVGELSEDVAVHTRAELDEDHRIAGTDLPPDAIVRGTLRELWLSAGEPQVTRRSTRYVAGHVPDINPELARSKQRWETAQARIPELAREAEKKQRARDQVAARRNQAGRELDAAYDMPIGNTIAEMNARNRAINQRSAILNQVKNEHLMAEFSYQTAEAAHATAVREADELMRAYLATPPYIDVPLEQHYTYDEVVITVNGSAQASVLIAETASGRRWSVAPEPRATVQEQDRLVEAFPEAGIAGDGVDMPADGVLLRRLCTDLARDAVEQIAPVVRSASDRLLERARRAEHPDVALHWRVLAWRGQRYAEIDGAAATRQLEADTGLDLDGEGIDLARLPAYQ